MATTLDLNKLRETELSLNEIEELIHRIQRQLNGANEAEMLILSVPPKPSLPDLEAMDFDGKLKAIQGYLAELCVQGTIANTTRTTIWSSCSLSTACNTALDQTRDG